VLYVPGTQNICLAIRGRVEDRSVGRIGQDSRLDYDRFNGVSGIRQIPVKRAASLAVIRYRA
jgi:hypothetical protein